MSEEFIRLPKFRVSRASVASIKEKYLSLLEYARSLERQIKAMEDEHQKDLDLYRNKLKILDKEVEIYRNLTGATIEKLHGLPSVDIQDCSDKIMEITEGKIKTYRKIASYVFYHFYKLTIKQVAERLDINHATCDYHIKDVDRKLEIKDPIIKHLIYQINIYAYK